ncbi:(2Fe-2S)-binding protein [Paraburkholderia sabiae]|jgi:isoquinoline 1-oxidoreductase alpha subunit|uniref:(2Fe-2S)-binding protein n=1 Tax=Paraburkholderia sabiae TaxID=273251 RepID=A0ABU9Q3Y0_9BURK|nr:(2Fe-2S)-binding protein [Paraburkholderia sabiae]WJZ71622.1 (2Fe-2S)-binding protein [Paraburkholderia sabiae]CAD6519868.1 Isoquinoline 1-oxidoreductase subunit alpha [Paraburkholderia sabiae]CAG9189631.1 Isoquinoline 1-oxidoreductase subunit alpha [Paraburkholderia sabiae]
MLKLNINGKTVDVHSDPATPLLWVLRCELKMTGTKFGCGVGVCGACTVHVGKDAKTSCQEKLSDVGANKVTTIEGLQGPQARALKEAWLRVDVVQCGYCQSAQLMAASALIQRNPTPSVKEIDCAMHGIICRCGTYPRIRQAILEATGQVKHT